MPALLVVFGKIRREVNVKLMFIGISSYQWNTFSFVNKIISKKILWLCSRKILRYSKISNFVTSLS